MKKSFKLQKNVKYYKKFILIKIRMEHRMNNYSQNYCYLNYCN